MKRIYLFLALILFSQSAFAGLPPTTSKGQQDASTTTTFNFQAPNKQVTQVGGAALFETGNNNLLGNPSFEAATFGTFWTNAAGTTSLETTNVIHGKKSLKVTLSAQTLNLTQDSTLYASQFAGSVQGLAMVRVKTTVSGVKLCARQAATTSTSLCVSAQGSGNWELLKVPYILGTTSNGLAIVTASSVTGDVYVDDAFVGAVDLKQDVDASRIAGESYFAATASCTGSTSSTTVGPLTTNAACPGPTIATTNNLGDWQTTDANLFRQTINNLPAGKYKATFQYYGYQGVGSQSSVSITDGTTTCEPIGAPSDTGANTPAQVSCVFTYAQSGNRYFELVAGVASGGGLTIYNSYTNPKTSTKFTLEYFNNTSTYSSTNADTDWVACTLGATQGFTFTSQAYQCKKDGGDLLIKGSGVVASSSATEMRMGLPTWGGNQLTSKNSSIIPSIQIAGHYVRSVSSTSSRIALIEPSVAYFTFADQISAGGGLAKLNGSSVAGAGESVSVNVRIPIEGWENSNVIIGQFNEVPTVPGASKVVTRHAHVACGNSGSAISNTIGSSWATIANGASAGLCTLTITGSFTGTPVCQSTNTGGANRICNFNGNISNTTINLSSTSGGTPINGDCELSCTGIAP